MSLVIRCGWIIWYNISQIMINLRWENNERREKEKLYKLTAEINRREFSGFADLSDLLRLLIARYFNAIFRVSFFFHLSMFPLFYISTRIDNIADFCFWDGRRRRFRRQISILIYSHLFLIVILWHTFYTLNKKLVL